MPLAALFSLTALSVPAQAATGWLLHVDIVGTPTDAASNTQGSPVLHQPNPWTAPADATNPITLPSYSSIGIGASGVPDQSFSCKTSVNLTVKITGTWQGSDPAPPSIYIIETAQATAHFSGNTGGYDAPVSSVSDGLESAPAGSSVAVTPVSVPPAHLKKRAAVHGRSPTLSR